MAKNMARTVNKEREHLGFMTWRRQTWQQKTALVAWRRLINGPILHEKIKERWRWDNCIYPLTKLLRGRSQVHVTNYLLKIKLFECLTSLSYDFDVNLSLEWELEGTIWLWSLCSISERANKEIIFYNYIVTLLNYY